MRSSARDTTERGGGVASRWDMHTARLHNSRCTCAWMASLHDLCTASNADSQRRAAVLATQVLALVWLLVSPLNLCLHLCVTHVNGVGVNNVRWHSFTKYTQ